MQRLKTSILVAGRLVVDCYHATSPFVIEGCRISYRSGHGIDCWLLFSPPWPITVCVTRVQVSCNMLWWPRSLRPIIFLALAFGFGQVSAQVGYPPISLASRESAQFYPVPNAAVSVDSDYGYVASEMPEKAPWISTSPSGTFLSEEEIPAFDQPDAEPILLADFPQNYWYWQLLPDGLIYRSYWASPREPRISTTFFKERDGRTLWDATLGGRVPLIRFGSGNTLHPQGWQLDAEGAAIVRLNLDEERDVEASDFRFGFPITYGVNQWQFKFGYYHLSSHLGDEFIMRNNAPTDRLNYVRDAINLGVSYYPISTVRLYAETAYAFFVAGGAQPWEFQFGLEYSKAGLTGARGTPFFAVNAHLREELDFGGDLSMQAGWLWRGRSGHVLRTGVSYMNGKSTQYQFFRDSEQQIGFGLWYDY